MLLKDRSCFVAIALCFFAVVIMILPLVSYANSISVVPLKYRDAGTVKDIITPLLSQGSGVSIDNNSVIVSAPAVELKKIRRVIQSIDTPKVQLLVSIYRGKYPEKKGVKLATTQSGLNQSQMIRVEEGQTLVVEEKRVLALSVEHTQYVNNTGATVAVDPVASSSTTVVVNDGQLAIADDAVGGGEDVGLGELVLDHDGNIAAAEVLQRERKEWIAAPTGLHLRVTLVGNKQARVAAAVVSAVDNTRVDSSQNVQDIVVSRSVETLSTFALSSWVKVSEHVHFSHRPTLNDRRKVYSTDTLGDKQQSVWMKVDVLP